MQSNEILYSVGGYDECYTPRYAVLPLLEFLEPYRHKIIWCPFDTPNSEFVKVFEGNNFNLTYSHICYGQDFYVYEPAEWDIIISNPPFTNKRYIFNRAISLGKPFALLMSNTWLNDAAPKQLFRNIDLQLLMFDKRIQYNSDNKITFSSSYYCRDFLPKQILMRELNIH